MYCEYACLSMTDMKVPYTEVRIERVRPLEKKPECVSEGDGANPDSNPQ